MLLQLSSLREISAREIKAEQTAASSESPDRPPATSAPPSEQQQQHQHQVGKFAMMKKLIARLETAASEVGNKVLSSGLQQVDGIRRSGAAGSSSGSIADMTAGHAKPTEPQAAEPPDAVAGSPQLDILASGRGPSEHDGTLVGDPFPPAHQARWDITHRDINGTIEAVSTVILSSLRGGINNDPVLPQRRYPQ